MLEFINSLLLIETDLVFLWAGPEKVSLQFSTNKLNSMKTLPAGTVVEYVNDNKIPETPLDPDTYSMILHDTSLIKQIMKMDHHQQSQKV